MLRRSVPVIFDRRMFRISAFRKKYSFLWLPFPRKTNETLSAEQVDYFNFKIKCPSTYDTCVLHDIFKYFSSVKPWSGEINIALHLPVDYINLFEHGVPFNYFHYEGHNEVNAFQKSIPSNNGRIFILAQSRENFDKIWSNFSIKNWILRTLNWDSYRLDMIDRSPQVKIFEHFVGDLDQMETTLKHPCSIVKTLKRVSIKLVQTFNPEKVNSYEYIVNFSEDRSFLLAHGKIGTTMITIKTADYQSARSVYDIYSHFDLCANYLTQNSLSNPVHKLPFKNQDKLWHGIVSLWHLIFKNLTYSTGTSDQICMNSKYIPMKTNHYTRFQTRLKISAGSNNDYMFYPFFFPEVFQDLRFISCGGQNGVSTVVFEELLSVYEMDVWIWMFISLIMVAAFIAMLSPSGRALFVLSNAYKNTNVYNLISPRKPIPYQFYSEPLRDNFTSMTRFDRIQVNFDTLKNEWKSIFSQTTEKAFFHASSNPKFSENWIDFGDVESISIQAEVKVLNVPNPGLIESSNMHPQLADLTSKAIHKMWPNWRHFDENVAIKYFMSLEDTIRENEEDNIFEFLNDCNKTAAIVPRHISNHFGRKIQKYNSRKNVFVGIEKYLNLSILFEIGGMVHPNAMNRLSLITSSGIQNWWLKFTSQTGRFVPFEQSQAEIEVPTMKGNIQIIFYVHLLGVFVAAAIFLPEIIRIVFAHIMWIFKILWQKCFVTICRKLCQLLSALKTIILLFCWERQQVLVPATHEC